MRSYTFIHVDQSEAHRVSSPTLWKVSSPAGRCPVARLPMRVVLPSTASSNDSYPQIEIRGSGEPGSSVPPAADCIQKVIHSIEKPSGDERRITIMQLIISLSTYSRRFDKCYLLLPENQLTWFCHEEQPLRLTFQSSNQTYCFKSQPLS